MVVVWSWLPKEAMASPASETEKAGGQGFEILKLVTLLRT